MNVMVVGSGGREHCIAWKLRKDGSAGRIVCCPGNAGIAGAAECVPVPADDLEGLLAVSKSHGIDLVVFGPEEPLVRGAADWMRARGVTVFGPSSVGARLEGSKVFAKRFMERHSIPTGEFEAFDSAEKALEFVRRRSEPLVVKADGLAKGKGVFVCESGEEAEAAVRATMVDCRFGTAGSRVVIEERLRGDELSVMAICDGERYVMLPFSQDHKRALENDEGPNTGGMGAYSPVSFAAGGVLRRVEDGIILPVLRGMSDDGSPYVGVLYVGLMLTAGGPKVLEFNCRFGDPETQAVLPVCDFDLAGTLELAATGRLPGSATVESRGHCACVVACSGGYPARYEIGKQISGLDELQGLENVLLFHAGTALDGDRLVTAGGRVLGVAGTGETLREALGRAYEAMGLVRFEGIHYRRDVGARGLEMANQTN
ncbi:MAG: phosphoribosylamine--glycine ligase [Candidatus Eisenbacteria bacterium]